MSLPLHRLRELPFPAQIRAIDAEIKAGRTAPLLRELCDYRDYQPLAYALASHLGALTNVDAKLIELLLDIPDTGVRRVLRALDEVATPVSFTTALADGAWTLPATRIAAVALIDRWLKNTTPLDHKQRADAGLAFCIEKLSEASIADIPDGHLMRMPGTALSQLDEVARAAGCLPAWRARQEGFAKQILDVLESQPKSLSQANAEELLSRQVYTDPGHFLVELLQNADDAGAVLWQVQVFDDRIEIEHDGTPFDALDVVGILSIGQTTKSKEQIGFFGVGFKSVYEICERPQLYSGVFSLEIADVSIPRPLRPIDDVPSGHTRLVLPLRQGRDESVSPEMLFRTLSELPAEVVLTLNSVRELDLRYGSHIRHVRGNDERNGRFRIDDGEDCKRYLVERTEAHYEGARGNHRASRTPILVAVPLDDDGLPTPSQGAPTIYSYLPTHERSGLRVLVHAHFDLPVDRERIDVSSKWNQWALTRAGDLLKKAISRLCQEWRPETKASGEVLDAVMSIVSLPGELNHPAFEAVCSELSLLEFLPSADGSRCAASRALVCADPRLRAAFATVALQGGGKLLRNLEGRDADVARWLGAETLVASSVVDEMARRAAEQGIGAPFDPPWASKLPEVGAALTEASVRLDALLALPCLPNSEGLAHIPSTLHRAEATLRVFLTHVQPLVRADLEEPGCTKFLEQLGVPVSRTRDLVAICSEPEAARSLTDHVGTAELVRYLQAAPPAELELISFANIVPNDRNSLSAVGDAWLVGDDRLATLVRNTGIRPALVDSDTEQLLGPSLKALGCRNLDVSAALTCIDNDSLQLEDERLPEFHAALDSIAHTLAPNVTKRLARTSIFPIRKGQPLPLVGNTVASIPYDEDLTEVWPDRDWLVPEVARLPYIRTLGIPIVGPEDLAVTLREPPVPSARRELFAYLTRHAGALSEATAEALSQASIWPDVHGTLRPLDELRRQAKRASVAALYTIWPRAKTVEAGESPGSAMALASAIRLEHRVVEPDLATAIHDLRNTQAMDSGPYRSGADLDLDNPEVAAVVTALLNDAADSLTRTTLRSICEAPIFLCTDGQRRRLGTASEAQRGRALRASGFLIPVFESLGFSILTEERAVALEPLLDALLLRPATIIDLIRETSVDDRELQEESAAQFRHALCSASTSLASLSEAQHSELSNLAMWPCNGSLIAAKDVVRGRSFDALLAEADLDRAALASCALSLLDPSAEHQAEVLSPYLVFSPPVDLLARAVQELALEGEPVRSQALPLASIGQVARLAAIFARHHTDPWSLPISVNTATQLVARPLLLASRDEVLACKGLDLAAELAHVDWQSGVFDLFDEGVGVENLGLETLGLRRMLDTFREASGEAKPATSHPALCSATARDAFYRWLLANCENITEDAQSLGLLGKSSVILSAEGVLREPRELLFDPTLPDLGIDWNPSSEVPEPLQNWLRTCYRPASKQLRPIVDHMVQALDDAADAEDGERIAAVLAHLAKILGADHETSELEELAKRFKLRKRLRVETADGQFEFARRLLAAEPLDADLVPRFATSPPASAARRYTQPQTLRLLRAAGAEDELGIAALRSYLGGDGRREGSDSNLAFACYLASAACRQASLRNDLDLRRAPWLPCAAGSLHTPESLYWPTPELETLIGREPRLYLHPEFVLRVPEASKWLPLRTAHDAALEDIAAHLRAGAASGVPASDEALSWLDARLADNDISKSDARGALAGIPMLVDDHGQMRRASELIVSGGRRLFGERRGNWSTGTRLRDLAEALEISRRPRAKDILAFFAQVHRELEAGPDLVQSDAALLDALPHCLDALIELGGRKPQRLPVTAIEGGRQVLMLLPATGTVGLPGQRDAHRILKLADGADIITWGHYLRSYGVGPEGEEPREEPSEEPKEEREVRAPRPDRAPSSRPPAESREDAEEEGPGVISRLRSWLRGDDDDSSPSPRALGERSASTSQAPGSSEGAGSRDRGNSDPEPPPFRPIDQRGWFRGDNPLSSQLASNPSWLADRTKAAEFGLAHAPRQLPIPHRYAPNAIFSDFDKRRQQWKPLRAAPGWREGGAPAGTLHMRGVLPSPKARIPLPLYGRLVGTTSSGQARAVEGRGHSRTSE